jgi:parvulin-like peptidyl-prolyl isomerase
VGVVVVCAVAEGAARRRTAPRKKEQRGSDTVVAEVNGEAITALQVDQLVVLKLLDEKFAEQMDALTREERDAFAKRSREEALEALIDQRLVRQEARKRREELPNLKAEVDYYLKDHMKRLERELGLAKLERELSKRDKSIREYRKEQREFLLQTRFLYRVVYSKVYVRPSEIHGYYLDHPSEFRVKIPLRFQQIWFHSIDFGTPEKAGEAAREARKALAEGASFMALWKKHSFDRDTAKVPGSEKKYPGFDSVKADLRGTLEKLEEGEVSEVLKFGGGWRLVRLVSRPRTKVTPFEEVQAEIKQKLMARKRAVAREAYLRKLRGKAFIRYFGGEADVQGPRSKVQG